ncbi:MAG: hypothetical protein HY367_03540 [Candidatus Aenigmarchaeota archaeon]|nr:hypothetical protein [Candidatus Aenigmarchaeota archaeon]
MGYLASQVGCPGKKEELFPPYNAALVVEKIEPVFKRDILTRGGSDDDNLVMLQTYAIREYLNDPKDPKDVCRTQEVAGGKTPYVSFPPGAYSKKVKQECKQYFPVVVTFLSEAEVKRIDENLDPNKTENPIGVLIIDEPDLDMVNNYKRPIFGMGKTGYDVQFHWDTGITYVRNRNKIHFFDAHGHNVDPQDLPVVKEGGEYKLGKRKAHGNIGIKPFSQQPASAVPYAAPAVAAPAMTAIAPANYSGRFASIEGDIETLNDHLDGLGRGYTGLMADTDALKREAQRTRQRVDYLDGRVDQLNRRR